MRWPGNQLALLWLVALYAAAAGVVLLLVVGRWQAHTRLTETVTASGEFR